MKSGRPEPLRLGLAEDRAGRSLPERGALARSERELYEPGLAAVAIKNGSVR